MSTTVPTGALAGLSPEVIRTSSGKEIFRFSIVALKDEGAAGEILASLSPGGAFFGRPLVLISLGGGAARGPGIRQQLKDFARGLGQNQAPIAVVCAETLHRLAIKALCILAPHGGPLKVVESEVEAMAWMDEVLKS